MDPGVLVEQGVPVGSSVFADATFEDGAGHALRISLNTADDRVGHVPDHKLREEVDDAEKEDQTDCRHRHIGRSIPSNEGQLLRAKGEYAEDGQEGDPPEPVDTSEGVGPPVDGEKVRHETDQDSDDHQCSGGEPDDS